MMLRNLFRRIPGCRAFASVAVLLAVSAGTNCYRFSGGGGFPSEIKTMFIETFENSTSQFELDQQLFRKLNERLPRAFGVHTAAEERADAVVRGKIVRYEDAAANYRPGDTRSGVQVLQHQIQITISITLIDKRTNTVLWESTSLTGRGDYQPSTQNDQSARETALNNLVQQIIDGAQSQW
jgi:hypothetical protein